MTVYVLLPPSLPQDIDICQYRCMPKSLVVLAPADTAPVGAAPADTAACCPPLSVQPLSQAQAEQVAPLLKALADPVRLRLMSLVASHPGGEACVCDLNEAFDLSQPTISHHLKVLHEAGLLDRDKRGVWVYYRARTEALASLGTLIGSPPPAPIA
jgi:ArsR family transcriptional regulator, arsenate/arsenite/antimonite-responsive transcriptional repressor